MSPTYDSSRLEGNVKAALSTACFHITEAIEAAIKAERRHRRRRSASALIHPRLRRPSPSPGSPEQSELRTLATKHVAELLSMLNGGTAGLSIVPSDPSKVKRWADNVL